MVEKSEGKNRYIKAVAETKSESSSFKDFFLTLSGYKNVYENSKGFDLEYSNMSRVKKFYIRILLCIDKIHFPHLD